MPVQAIVGNLPIDRRTIRAEKRGSHFAYKARIELVVTQIDDEVREILNRVPDREIVEVKHAEPTSVHDQLLEQEVSVHKPFATARQPRRLCFELRQSAREPCSQAGKGLDDLAGFRADGIETVGRRRARQSWNLDTVKARQPASCVLEKLPAIVAIDNVNQRGARQPVLPHRLHRNGASQGSRNDKAMRIADREATNTFDPA